MYQRMQKLSAALVAVFMTTSMLVTSFAQEQISETHWACQKMLKWSDLRVIKGSGSGNLRPDDTITRAEVATIINNVFGFISKSTKQFSDVKSHIWYADELLKAREAGYYNGYNGNLSKAEFFITREDTAVMLSNVFCLSTENINNSFFSFKDASSISSYAIAAVKKLSEAGVIKGYSDGNFLPKSNITRAEFISIMDNLVKFLCNTPGTYGSKNVSGHVIINQPSVELKDTSVNGSLYLTEGIGNGSVILNNVSIAETTFISGGTDDINIIDSQLNSVILNTKNSTAKLVLSGTSQVRTFCVNCPSEIQVEASAKASFEVNSDYVAINGQPVLKGIAIVENGNVSQNISEIEPDIPASIPTSTPTTSPTNKSGSSGSGNYSNNTNGNKTSKPKVTPNPTSQTLSSNSTSTSTPSQTPTSNNTSTSTPSQTSTSNPTPTSTPSQTSTSNNTPTSTPSQTSTSNPTPTSTPSQTPTSNNTSTSTPSQTSTSNPTSTSTPSQTLTPLPTEPPKTSNIVGITDSNSVTVEIGCKPELPAKVTVIYEDGSEGLSAVMWPEIDTSKAGEQIIEGTVSGTEFKANIKIIVLEELILENTTVCNLKEIVLKFNRPLIHLNEVENVKNYSIGDDYFTQDNYFTYKNYVQYAQLSSDKMYVTLFLKYELEQKDDIVVKVKSAVGLSQDTEATIDYIEDAEAPKVIEVRALGNSLLKVTFSEPVQYSTELSNFTIDDEYFDCSIPVLSYNGKTVSLYLTSALSPGAHKLVVSNIVCDYALLGIENNKIEFIVAKDKIKPTGVIKSASGEKVVIQFCEEVEFTDVDNISTVSSAEIESIELSEDDMTLTVYFYAESPFPSAGGKITIRDLTDLSGNTVDFEITVSPII